MKQIIRCNTFETNSSTTHSMVIIPDDAYAAWENNELLYINSDWGANKKLLEMTDGYNLVTREFIEQSGLFTGKDKMPNPEDFDDEDDYYDAFKDWCYYHDMVTFDIWNDSELESDECVYRTKNGEILHIQCEFGYDG